MSELDLRRELVDRLNLQRGDVVLEVAIGTGGNVPLIRRRTQNVIFGLDLSEGMLRRCLDKANERGWDLELCLGNAEYLPYKSERFDVLLNFGGMSYFNDKRRVLEEMYRVVKSGGNVVVGSK
ncbi:MAG: class I SAM-dependent methyltransferase [Candidatus Freyarchaeota archaeon]|nr:methyltransferase domain-containing protein [Candidatus Freyrarchaeum guaymaensis]